MPPLHSIHARPARQQGAATVLVMLALLAAMLLALLFVNRGLLLELRMSANQSRATVAFEAAEAGVEWALAMLNEPARIGSDCRADVSAATSFRDRHLVMSGAPGGFAVRMAAAGATPLRPACVRDGAGWSCRCPADAAATLASPAGNDDVAAFVVEFRPGGHPGGVKIVSTGCVDPGAACTPGSAATARIETSLALRPALATPPAAALTARGDIVTSAPIEALNPDPAANGLALHAGGLLAAPFVHLGTSAGASTAGSVAGRDAWLAGLTGDRLFTTHFGLAKTAWRDQPAVRRLRCDGECGAALAEVVGSDVVAAMVWIDGDAVLEGPLTLGRADRPAAIVVSGALQLRGAVDVYGIVYATSVAWNGVGAGLLRGALVSESGYAGDAAATFHRDPQVLDRLTHETGSFVKVPGRWRDF